MLFFGPSFESELHKHHAAQIAIGLQGKILLRESQSVAWQEGDAFFIPPDVPHVFDAQNSPCALLYLYSDSMECEQVCKMHGVETISLIDSRHVPFDQLKKFLDADGSSQDIDALCHLLLGISSQPAQRRPFDQRFSAALEWISNHMDQPIKLADVAKAANTSQSWLSHRFREQKGVSLRRYVLWCRLRIALECALKGATLTQAANMAGFSDSAHFTRTFRENYGVNPSFLFGAGQSISVKFFDSGQIG